jgi:hypothetical protein
VFWRPCRCPKRLLNPIQREYYLYYYIIRVACLYVATNKVVGLVDPINIFVFFSLEMLN